MVMIMFQFLRVCFYTCSFFLVSLSLIPVSVINEYDAYTFIFITLIYLVCGNPISCRVSTCMQRDMALYLYNLKSHTCIVYEY